MLTQSSWPARLGVLLVAVGVEGLIVCRAVLPLPDAIDSVHVAQELARDGWAATVARQPVQPLFPLAVAAARGAIRPVLSEPAGAWALAAQVASLAAFLAAVAGVFVLWRLIAGERVALVAALVLACLPAMARLGAAGTSDTLQLALATWALAALVAAWQSWESARLAPHKHRAAVRAWTWACGAGLAAGLALLTGPAAWIVVAATTLACGAAVVWSFREAPPSAAFRRAVGLAGLWLIFVGTLTATVVPYLSAAGATTPRAALARLAAGQAPEEAWPLNAPAPPRNRAALDNSLWVVDGNPATFGRKDSQVSTRVRGLAAALKELLSETAEAFHYGVGLLAIAGLWLWRGRQPTWADRLLQLVALGTLAAGAYLVCSRGYLSARHLALAVVVGVGPAAHALGQLAERVSLWFAARGATSHGSATWPDHAVSRTRPTLAAWGLCLGLLLATCLPRLGESLEAANEPHRRAAVWLRDAATPRAAAALDTRGWTALYSGRPTYRADAAAEALADPRLAYLVVEQAELDIDSPRGATLRTLTARAGTPLARFAPHGERGPTVVVYGLDVARLHTPLLARRPEASDAR